MATGLISSLNKVKRYMRQSIQEFKNGTSKICERRPLKKLAGCGLLKQTYPFKFFEGCLSQILLGPFSNNVSHI